MKVNCCAAVLADGREGRGSMGSGCSDIDSTEADEDGIEVDYEAACLRLEAAV
jgi:hypothetical protein